MSTTYKVVAGDSFETIARKQYGTEREAKRISDANPGVAEPLTAGTVLALPTLPTAPVDLAATAPAANPSEVAILVNGQRFRRWDSVRITRSMDTVDTASFGAPFDSSLPGFRQVFRPFSYRSMDITVGGAPLFTGTVVAIDPLLEEAQKVVAVSGYSLPGVLSDCTSPASSYPLEFSNQGLPEIAAALAAPFGLAVEFRADAGTVFERVAVGTSQRVMAFLTQLAKQRNLIIASTERGALLFWRGVAVGEPVAHLEQGLSPVLSVVPVFSPQSYYSHITGIQPAWVGIAGDQFTQKNSRLEGVVRPFTFDLPDILGADASLAVRAKAGRMLANAAAYSVRVDTWRDSVSDALWAPNTTVRLLAPDAMVYTEYEFLIRSVEFDRVENAETATLELALPGTFSGEIPEVLPWD